MVNFNVELFKNPFVAGLFSAVVMMVFKLLDNRLSGKQEGIIEYIKYSFSTASIVVLFVYMTKSKSMKEEILTTPFFD